MTSPDLINLVPYGTNSEMVEDIHSYIKRLAYIYRVTPLTLMKFFGVNSFWFSYKKKIFFTR